MIAKAMLVGLLLAVTICLQACESPPSHISVSTVSDGRTLTSMIAVDGSSTMISLVKMWTQEFKKSNPDIPFSITANDSGGGISSLIKRTTDIALSSRDLTPDEISTAQKSGVKLKRFTVARDAIAFIVNPNNPVDSLKLDQLEKIYAGQITNWSQVGGKAMTIVPFTREKDSGTFFYFKDHVMHGAECAPTTKLIPSVYQTVDKVASDANAIAFVGLHHALDAQDKVKILGLKLIDQSKAVKPSASSSINGYPLSRPLLIFADEQPKPSTQKFIDFCLSEPGQKLVSTTGYIPIKQ